MIDVIALLAPIVITILVILVFLLILLAAINDLMKPSAKTGERSKRNRMTIIVLAEDAQSLRLCLRSVAQASFGRYDIVVVDISKHNDHRAIRSIAKTEKDATLYRPRIRHDHMRLLNLAYSRSRKAAMVLVVHDSVRFIPKTSDGLFDRELFTSSTRPIRLRALPVNPGFLGVVLTLRTAMTGLIEYGAGLLKAHRRFHVEGRAYILPASSLKSPTTFTDGWRYHMYAPQLAGGEKLAAAAFNRQGMWNWLTVAVLLIVGSMLLMAAVKYDQPNPFMYVWLLISIGSIAAISFDPFIRFTQKLRSVMCVGFMPILILMALVVKMNRV